MWKWIVAILLSFGLVLSLGVPVFAGTSADVTITATGYICAAPGGLILTYVNDYEVGISWTKGIDAANTMVRGAVGRVPTSRTDGYLVYYGSGNTTSDTGVSFEETAAPIYYRAWSQNAGGIWEETGIWNFIEGVGMTLIALFILAGIITYIALRHHSIPFGIVSSAVWIGILAFTRAKPIGGIALGSAADEAFIAVFIGAATVIPFLCWRLTKAERAIGNGEEPSTARGNYDNIRRDKSIRHGTVANSEGYEEYKDRIHRLAHPVRRR